MRQKKLVITLLVLLAFVVSGFTYAYWASSIAVAIEDNNGATITIGSGQVVNTTATVGTVEVDGSGLIPDSVAPGNEDTAVITIPVTWASGVAGSVGATGTLVVSDPVLSTTDDVVTTAQLNAMFTVTLTVPSVAINIGETEEVVITVKFANEPASKAIYDALVLAGSIKLTVTLAINPAA